MHLAVLSENEKIVEHLLKRGAFTNTVNVKGDTELHYAVMACNSRVVAILLNAGADPTIRNSHGDTALTLANKCGVSNLYMVLDNHRRKSTMMSARDDNAMASNNGGSAGSGIVSQPNLMKVVVVRATILDMGGDRSSDEDGQCSPLEEGRPRLESTNGSVDLLKYLRSPGAGVSSNASGGREGYPDPCCVVRHRVGDLQRECTTVTQIRV